MRPLQNRHAERTSARYCPKSPDYPHRNSVAPLFSSTGFSSPKQARAPDSCVPCSARLGQPGRAGGVAGSGAGAEGGACLRLGAGSGSARRRKFPGRWGRRTHPESLVSASPRRRQRGAAVEVSDRRSGMRCSSIPQGGGGEAVSLRRVRGGKPSWGAGGGAPRTGTAPQVLSGAAEVRVPRGKRSSRGRAAREWTQGQRASTGSSWSSGRPGRVWRRQGRGALGHPRSDPPASRLPGVAGRRRAPTLASGYTHLLQGCRERD